MENNKLKTARHDPETQVAFPTFMELVLDTVERVLRDNTNRK